MAYWGSFTKLLASFSGPSPETTARFEYAANDFVDVRSFAEGKNVEGGHNTESIRDSCIFHEELPQFVSESPLSGSVDGNTSRSMGEEIRIAGVDIDWSDTVMEEDADADCIFSDNDSDDNVETPVGGTNNVDVPGDDDHSSEHPDAVDANDSTTEESYEHHIPEATPYERRLTIPYTYHYAFIYRTCRFVIPSGYPVFLHFSRRSIL